MSTKIIDRKRFRAELITRRLLENGDDYVSACLQGISDKDLAELYAEFDLRHFSAGQRIFNVGDWATGMHIIVHGSASFEKSKLVRKPYEFLTTVCATKDEPVLRTDSAIARESGCTTMHLDARKLWNAARKARQNQEPRRSSRILVRQKSV